MRHATFGIKYFDYVWASGLRLQAGVTAAPSRTVGESRERGPMSREGTTTTGLVVGTTNPENSTGR
jgi:hypothetical protein